jgi:hypothetical protein
MNNWQKYSLYHNMARHYNVPMACEHVAAFYAAKLGIVSRKGTAVYTGGKRFKVAA